MTAPYTRGPPGNKDRKPTRTPRLKPSKLGSCLKLSHWGVRMKYGRNLAYLGINPGRPHMGTRPLRWDGLVWRITSVITPHFLHPRGSGLNCSDQYDFIGRRSRRRRWGWRRRRTRRGLRKRRPSGRRGWTRTWVGRVAWNTHDPLFHDSQGGCATRGASLCSRDTTLHSLLMTLQDPPECALALPSTPPSPLEGLASSPWPVARSCHHSLRASLNSASLSSFFAISWRIQTVPSCIRALTKSRSKSTSGVKVNIRRRLGEETPSAGVAKRKRRQGKVILPATRTWRNRFVALSALSTRLRLLQDHPQNLLLMLQTWPAKHTDSASSGRLHSDDQVSPQNHQRWEN